MADQPSTSRIIRDPSFADAIIPVVTLIGLVAGGVFLFGLAAVDGPMQVALILSAAVASLILLKNGHPWHEISKSAGTALASVSTPFFILFGVGALIGTWNHVGHYSDHGLLWHSTAASGLFLCCCVCHLCRDIARHWEFLDNGRDNGRRIGWTRNHGRGFACHYRRSGRFRLLRRR